MTPPPTTPARTALGTWLISLGVAVPAVGLGLYLLKISSQEVPSPWILPLTGTLGLAHVGAGLWQRGTVLRWLVLVVVLLFAGAEWAFVLLTRLPTYAGPARLASASQNSKRSARMGQRSRNKIWKGPKTTSWSFFAGGGDPFA